jgi:hypothetical protein
VAFCSNKNLELKISRSTGGFQSQIQANGVQFTDGTALTLKTTALTALIYPTKTELSVDIPEFGDGKRIYSVHGALKKLEMSTNSWSGLIQISTVEPGSKQSFLSDQNVSCSVSEASP